jgi:hypothetical protein
MLTDDNGINEKRFRSVLPHEPLPIDGDSKGYVHLQGAFEPKRNKLTNDSDKKSSTTTTSSSSSSSLLSYWKSPEALEGALLVALRDDYQYMLQIQIIFRKYDYNTIVHMKRYKFNMHSETKEFLQMIL